MHLSPSPRSLSVLLLLLQAPGLLATATAPLYAVPAELLRELGLSSTSSSGKTADALSSASSSCTYPPSFVISQLITWAPATTNTTTNATNTTSPAPYIAFRFTDSATGIDTACGRNASSVSLKAKTATSGIALRYACDDPVVAFIWQPAPQTTAPGGVLTLIETACPGRTTTVFEASGATRPPAPPPASLSSSSSSTFLQCVTKRGDARTSSHAGSSSAAPDRSELGAVGDGTLCWATAPIAGNFTSLQPSPLQS